MSLLIFILKTPQKILKAALLLFNQNGLDAVTLHTIATEIGISQGNLNYHFKKRSDIVEALYLQLVEEMDKAFVDIDLQREPFKAMFLFSAKIMEGLYAYRFIMLDFAQTMRRHPVIKEHYRKLYAMRQAQTKAMYDMLIAEGLMRKESFDGEYDNLALRSVILGDNWLAESEILFDMPKEEMIPYMQKVLNQLMFPYLTDLGQAEYLKAEREYFSK